MNHERENDLKAEACIPNPLFADIWSLSFVSAKEKSRQQYSKLGSIECIASKSRAYTA